MSLHGRLLGNKKFRRATSRTAGSRSLSVVVMIQCVVVDLSCITLGLASLAVAQSLMESILVVVLEQARSGLQSFELRSGISASCITGLLSIFKLAVAVSTAATHDGSR